MGSSKRAYRYKCHSPGCTARPFAENASLLQHITWVHNSELGHLIKCLFCTDVLQLSAIYAHVQAVHPYKCLLCPERFNEATTWTKHMDEAHRQNCGFCNAFFWNPKELITHVQQVHVRLGTTAADNDGNDTSEGWYERPPVKERSIPAQKGKAPERIPQPDNAVPRPANTTYTRRKGASGKGRKTPNSTEDTADDKISEPIRIRCGFCAVELEPHELKGGHRDLCPNRCGICLQLIAGDKFNIAEHYRVQHPLKCRICHEEYICLMHLYRHMEDAHKTIMCWICTSINRTTELSFIKYETLGTRDDHVANAHYLAFGCSRCSIHVQSRAELDYHERACRGPSYYCADCSLEFGSERELNLHLDLHIVRVPEVPTITEFTCPVCLKEFKTKARCDAHMASKKKRCKRKAPRVQCLGKVKGCKKSFKTEEGMISHLESGACKSGMKKRILDRIIQANDVRGTVTHVVETIPFGKKKKKLAAALPVLRQQLFVEDNRVVTEETDITPGTSYCHTPTSSYTPRPSFNVNSGPHSLDPPFTPATSCCYTPTHSSTPGTPSDVNSTLYSGSFSAATATPVPATPLYPGTHPKRKTKIEVISVPTSGLGTPASSLSPSFVYKMDPAKLALKLQSLPQPTWANFTEEVRYHCPAMFMTDAHVGGHKKRQFKYLSGLLMHIRAKCEDKVSGEVTKRAVAVLDGVFKGGRICGSDGFRGALPASKC